METVVQTSRLQRKYEKKEESEDQRIRILIHRKFRTHEDYGHILNLLEEYGPVTMAGVIRRTYDPAFAY